MSSIRMPDIFSQHKMRVVLHIASQTDIIVERCVWIKNELHYKCLVPQKDEKGKYKLCNATYSENEIELITNPRLKIEQNINLKKYGIRDI